MHRNLSKTLKGGYFRQMLRRVSGADQNLAHQVDAVVRAAMDTENIHTDRAGGAKASRSQLDTVLAWLRSGDILVIARLDRLGRSVLHRITLGADLRDRGIGLKVLEQGIHRSHTATVTVAAARSD